MTTRRARAGSILYRIVAAIALLDYQQASSVMETAKSTGPYTAPKPYDFFLSLGTLETMKHLRSIFYLRIAGLVLWVRSSLF